MTDALLGHTGYVGSTLLRQRSFGALFDSKNIHTVGDTEFDLVVCAAAPAQKWIANRDPEADRARLQGLMAALETVRCRKFVLVSTVDVLSNLTNGDEGALPQLDSLHPYGRHRRELEVFVTQRFPDALIVRLPALVGPGLRKNALHDLRHGHETYKIDSRSTFQFYPMVNLWADLELALTLGMTLVHFATHPLSVADIARDAMHTLFKHTPHGAMPPAFYDIRSRYAAAFGGSGGYLYDRREVLMAVRAYMQSEPPKPGFI